MIKDLEDWKDKIKISNKLIIVEGKKDKEALVSLSIENIFVLKNQPLYKVVEEAAKIAKEVIILTDFDNEGKKLYSILREGLEKNGVKIDKQFREFLMNNTKLVCVEGIEKLY